MQSFLVSAGVVALAEIGDKTQLLSLVLAARYRKPLPIILGVLAATLANHAPAGGIGTLLAGWLSPTIMNWAVVASFALMAVWILVPDKLDEGEIAEPKKALGVFGATLVAFFLAEMGDKTQVATIAMAAHYPSPVMVVVGTTLGMLIADVAAVFIGDKLAGRIPMKLVHGIAAAMFAVLGVATLLGAGASLGF